MSSGEEDLPLKGSKRQCRERIFRKGKGNQRETTHTDQTYGQKSMFPVLDNPTAPREEDIECEDENDALEYLRSVR